MTARGDCPFVALPAFPSRVFRHGYVFVNTRAGIRAPKDLEGKRVGVPLYTRTAAIWVRGHLAHELDVRPDTIQWLEGAPLLKPAPIEANRSGQSLEQLLAAGTIDALIGSRKPPTLGRSPEIARLFPDFRALERTFYLRTKIFPIMHLVAIRRELYQQHPVDRGEALHRLRRVESAGARPHALRRLARRHAVVADVGGGRGGRAVWRRCLAVRHRANRPTLPALVEQDFITLAMPIEALFVPLGRVSGFSF